MVKAKRKRNPKRRLGQFLTPTALASEVIRKSQINWDVKGRYLEPSFGQGAFIIPLVENLMEAHGSRSKSTIKKIFEEQIFGTEIDPNMYDQALSQLTDCYGSLGNHNLINADFFATPYEKDSFDAIVGNPPFGGVFDARLEDSLDKRFGHWSGTKLKKETYSFFIAASLDLLKDGGLLVNLASDTFLTIKTMSGLRLRLMDQTKCDVERLESFSEETNQTVLVVRAQKGAPQNSVKVCGSSISRAAMELTGNFSWGISEEFVKYFEGPSLSEFIVCTSGMTIGDNELFVRSIADGTISEPYIFEYFDDPITLGKELARARLGHLSPKQIHQIKALEDTNSTRRNLRVRFRKSPETITLPHPNYLPYNKACSGVVFRPPTHVVYWEDEGDAVLTFKRNGPWYLHGVGGARFFKRKGLTWSLIAPRINMRFLDEGYILDSGAPCAFLRDGIAEDELWFIFAWSLSDLANKLLKGVINHTRNIQSKDVERLPYPFWVNQQEKASAIAAIRQLLAEARQGRNFDQNDPEIKSLSGYFVFNNNQNPSIDMANGSRRVGAKVDDSDRTQFLLSV